MIDDLLAGHRPRCWVADRWAAQQDSAETHQLCLAHVLRDVQYALDAGDAAFAPALRRLLCWAIAVGRRRANLNDATLAQSRAKAERRLNRVLAIPVTTETGTDLLRQTKRWRSQFFTFMTDRQVPPTNNGAERALRPSVVFRKVTNGFRSLWGADVHALTRSVAHLLAGLKAVRYRSESRSIVQRTKVAGGLADLLKKLGIPIPKQLLAVAEAAAAPAPA